MKTLHLTLKKKWFDMILSGEKKEEYRDLKPYWESRLLNEKKMERVDSIEKFQLGMGCEYFDQVIFKNGYQSDAPMLIIECNGIEIREGRQYWGAVENKKYFVIRLGNILETQNIR